ncbi:hypothetical protein K2173_017329 [Erythroxylum novogranatense]|uniref:F-box domain-containing protein n=1 Tax=Erythroxylum novogranatense TaxID=1862640 RepID=A0AAV8TLZ4_9ROSI|nr:hypothetical protein K2173_017329 [Erythroxylum novogranatense]
MEHNDCCVLSPTRKRKLQENVTEMEAFPLNKLNQDLLERVLSWLPTSSFYRLTSVCKRWKSVTDSASFKLACYEVPSRDPWFFMVDPHMNQSTVFDSAERSWKKLNYPTLLQNCSNRDAIPVAAAGGLVCFRSDSGDFITCNPVTGSCRQLPQMQSARENLSLCAIAMGTSTADKLSYKLVLVTGELPRLSYKAYNSNINRWEEEILLKRNVDESQELESTDDSGVYFLSKAGNVVDLVVTDMHRSPSKQYSSVTTLAHGEEMVYFLSSSGTIVACNLTHKCFSEYPRLFPAFSEYSIDLVVCRGEMLVVALSEFCESASLRVWRYEEDSRSWQQIVMMPPAMSHEFYEKKVDINCVGAGDKILVCLSCPEFYSYVVCDLRTTEWTELPKCFTNGETVEFMSAFAFEPRIEASV